jgi:hypothetical protein
MSIDDSLRIPVPEDFTGFVDPDVKQDHLYYRLKSKALNNQLAIAVGSSCSDSRYSIPSLGRRLIGEFELDTRIDHDYFFFANWNELVSKAEEKSTRASLVEFVSALVSDAEPNEIHRKIAQVPISNFIDTTFDRSFYKALLAAGRKPICHDWGTSQAMGSWKQSKPEEPTIFFMLPPTENPKSSWGIYEPTGRSKGRNIIQIENVRDMLLDKDLVLLDYPAQEAESILHLYHLHMTTEKIVDYTMSKEDAQYWAYRGVYMNPIKPEMFIEKLLPYTAFARPGIEKWQYGDFDGFVGGRTLLSAMRTKPFDCFISHFSGDKEFVRRLSHDLESRELEVWLDESQIEIGDSISSKIEEGLARSYAFIIVLSAEALTRAWVKKELQAAHALNAHGEFKILPVLHKECEIPPLLADYKFADFRDEKRYHEQLRLLESSIKSAVRRAQRKR